MSTDIPEYIILTQNTLGQIIKKPALTTKLLTKPPFRFLHDIFLSFNEITNFTELTNSTSFFTNRELSPQDPNTKDNRFSKEDKVKFLSKLVEIVHHVTGNENVVKYVDPNHIVCGTEPEYTNLLLQELYQSYLILIEKDEPREDKTSGFSSPHPARPSSRFGKQQSPFEKEKDVKTGRDKDVETDREAINHSVEKKQKSIPQEHPTEDPREVLLRNMDEYAEKHFADVNYAISNDMDLLCLEDEINRLNKLARDIESEVEELSNSKINQSVSMKKQIDKVKLEIEQVENDIRTMDDVHVEEFEIMSRALREL